MATILTIPSIAKKENAPGRPTLFFVIFEVKLATEISRLSTWKANVAVVQEEILQVAIQKQRFR